MRRTIHASLLVTLAGWAATAGLAVGAPYNDSLPPSGYPWPAYHYPYYPYPNAQQHVPPEPGPGYWPRTPAHATELPPGYPPVDNNPSQTPVHDWLRNGRPLGCWSSINTYGCGSLPATLSFIFGSCRTFYGEPCLKGAPPSALPPWAGQESGYRGGHPIPGEAGRDSLTHGYHFRRIFGGCPSCQ